MWSKRKEQYTRPCHKCGKTIPTGEERYVKDTNSPISCFYHLDCGETEWKNYQLSIKQKASECFSELRQLWDDLEPQIENRDLEVKEVKRIYALKKKINELLKTKNITDFDLTYWEAEVDFTNLKKAPADLDNFLKENASPRTLDIAKPGKYSKVRDCSHEKGIEPCSNDPTFFCCSYCWDTDSLQFLKKLRRQQTANINQLLDKHNISTAEFAKSSNNYQKLLNDFSSQEELKTVYQSAEKDLYSFLQDKGIDTESERERERERERAKTQSVLRTEINNLENKPNKTPKEKQDLAKKKKELEELEKPKNNPPPFSSSSPIPSKNNNFLLYIGLGIIGLLVIVFLVVISKKRKRA